MVDEPVGSVTMSTPASGVETLEDASRLSMAREKRVVDGSEQGISERYSGYSLEGRKRELSCDCQEHH